MSSAFSMTGGGVTAPRGYRAAGIPAGIRKPGARDLALLVSDTPASIAGVFTTNRVQAAPVRLCRARAAGGLARAIVVNSGCANACTGLAGRRDADRTAALAARLLRCPARQVFVCSTGTIGTRLPMDRIEAGLRRAAAALDPAGGPAAAEAILTTDTRPKTSAAAFDLGGRRVTVGGMAKGAGMIHPKMATLLVFLATDATVKPAPLRAALREAVSLSFNRLSVDGDRSTNDTALFLANGTAGAALGPGHPRWRVFRDALQAVTADLARQIVRDGEGATKLVTVNVRGATGAADAERVARAVANSLLVKTSWFGEDPNWGRVICAVGYSGAPVAPDRIDIAYDGLTAVRNGRSAGLAPEALHAVLAKPEFQIDIHLHQGAGSFRLTTCDCSDAYVRINASYMT